MSLNTWADQSFWVRFGVDHRSVLSYSVSLLSGLLLVECLLFVAVPAAESYETSLTGAFPLSFWLLSHAVLLGGICVLLGSALTDQTYWPHGLALVLGNYALFLFLPAARGYRLYGRGNNDILVHLGDVQGILGTGSLPGTWYPGIHVLMAELHMLGVPFGSMRFVAGFLFTALNIVGLGMLIRVLSGRQIGLNVGLAVGAPLFYAELHVQTQPFALSFMLLPVLVFLFECYRRSGQFANVWGIMILGLFLIYTHPVTTMMFAAFIGVAGAYSALHHRFVDPKTPKVSPRLAIVFLILLFSWIINFGRFRTEVAKILTPDSGPAPGAATVQQANEVQFTVLELALRFFQLYGTIALYGFTAGLIALFVGRRVMNGTMAYEWGFSLVHFGTGVGIAAAFVLNSLIVSGIIRASRFALLFAAVLLSLGLIDRIRAGDRRTVAALVAVIVATSFIGINTAYNPNNHLTYSESDGTEYLLTNSPDTEIYSAQTDKRMDEYILGTNDPGLYPRQLPRENSVPPDLGYQSQDQTAADTYGDAMLVTKEYDVRQHTASYYTEDQQEFLFLYGEEHLDRLGTDPTANRIYTNGGFEGWDIQPTDGAGK